MQMQEHSIEDSSVLTVVDLPCSTLAVIEAPPPIDDLKRKRVWQRASACPAGKCRRCHYISIDKKGGPKHSRDAGCMHG